MCALLTALERFSRDDGRSVIRILWAKSFLAIEIYRQLRELCVNDVMRVHHVKNCEGTCITVGSTPTDVDRTGRLTITKTGLNEAQEGTEFDKPTRITFKNEEVEVAFHKYLRTRRSDLYRDGVSASICFGGGGSVEK
jgi:hypothetical protein